MHATLPTRAKVLGGLLLAVAGCTLRLVGDVRDIVHDPVYATLFVGCLVTGCLSLLMVPVLRRPTEQVPMWTHAVAGLAAVFLGFVAVIGPVLAAAETKGFLADVPLPALLAWGLSAAGFAVAFWLHRGLPRRLL